MIDIHTHILPSLDDGAETLEESLQLLRMLKEQGVTDVFATPHFYPMTDNVYSFKNLVKEAYNLLTDSTKNQDLPRVHLGCELLYFENMGFSDSLSQFCYKGSKYLLLELSDYIIGNRLFDDLYLLQNQGIIPIIAHIERYSYAKNYRRLLNFIKKEKILTQINASSVLDVKEYKVIKKLIKKGIVTFIATDTHSVEERPPLMREALKILSEDFGEEYTENLVNNNLVLFKEITGETE